MKPTGRSECIARLRKQEGWNDKRRRSTLTTLDLTEVEKFKTYLRDAEHMTMDELWDKYGEAYLGPRPVKQKEKT
jgi:hypothetical protein